MMLAVRDTIEITLYPKKHPDIRMKGEIMQKIKELTTDIKKDLESRRKIDQFTNDFIPAVFNLRTLILRWISEENRKLNELFKFTEKELNELYKTDDSILNEHIRKAFEIYQKISAPILGPLSKRLDILPKKKAQQALPTSYTNFQLNLLYVPEPLEKGILSWLNASIKFELGLIIADLSNTSALKLSPKRKQELAEFILNQAERYGALSMIIGAWKPEEEDTSQETMNIKILAAALELELGIGFTAELDGFVQSYENHVEDAQNNI